MEIIYDTSNYGDMIKKNRIEKGYSQNELANKVGVSRQTINAWENSKVIPTTDKQEVIERILDFSFDNKSNLFHKGLKEMVRVMICDNYFEEDSDEYMILQDSTVYVLGTLLLKNCDTEIFKKIANDYYNYVVEYKKTDEFNETVEELAESCGYIFMCDLWEKDELIINLELCKKER